MKESVRQIVLDSFALVDALDSAYFRSQTKADLLDAFKVIVSRFQEVSAIHFLKHYGPVEQWSSCWIDAITSDLWTEQEKAEYLRPQRKDQHFVRRKKHRERHPVFLYLARNRRNGYTKIGWSSNIAFREKTLQSDEPEIEIIASWESLKTEEAALHDKYASQRVRGEWFSLSDDDIHQILEEHKGRPTEHVC